MTDIATRICAVMNDVGAIAKDRENAFHKYRYVSAEAVRAAVQKACVKHGLILRLTLSDETVSPTESVMKCACSVSMDGVTFVHLGDGWGAGCDKGDKAPMKSVTAASKYALANAFCISLGEDPEADESTDSALSEAIPLMEHQAIDEWNDAPERTQAEVLEAFDRAIASCEVPS